MSGRGHDNMYNLKKIISNSSETGTDCRLKHRFAAIVFGNIIMSLSISMMRLSLFGNDPFSCMNLGYSILTGLTFGKCVIIYNCIIILFVFLLDKSFINIGTLINMFLLGPASDIFYDILLILLGSNSSLTIRIILLLLGILISCYGTSAYICSNFGMGPYDAAGWIVEKKSKGRIKFRYARIFWDFLSVSIGFSLGSIVGIGTIIMALFTGPLISFFNRNINMPLIYGKNDN
ncbi:YczE/YyaS/YitT family protein [Pectinatus haikarae]|uniref:Membrane protein YczE n=2 Tax=Pectinatus haikarae TaxID=349096 RepID=A0ABT9YAF4_9FIRM|nr:hypothetical protein [Pectinatus haikarae]MDQ0204177.1 putative membrane protein YczE [Pectinatus haikarae]